MRLKNTINSDEESESAFVSKLTIANAALKSSSKVVLVKLSKFLCILVTLIRVEGDIFNLELIQRQIVIFSILVSTAHIGVANEEDREVF